MSKAYAIVLETGSYSDFSYSPIGVCLDQARAQEIVDAKNKEIADSFEARRLKSLEIKAAWETGSHGIDKQYLPFVELGGYGKDWHVQHNYKALYKQFDIPLTGIAYNDPAYETQKRQMYAFQNQLMLHLELLNIDYGALHKLTPIQDGSYELHEVDLLT